MDYGGMWDQGGSANCYFGNYVNSGGNHPVGGAHINFAGDHDPVTTWHYYVAEKQNGMGGNIVAGRPPASWRDTGVSGADLFIDTVGVSLSEMELEGSGTIVATMKNSGTTYIDDLDWSISIVGDSPLGRYFGGSALTNWLFRGRILSGGFSGDTTALSLAETEDIASGPVFGIGHVLVTITASVDDDVLAESSEDAFLLGGRLFLYYPEE